MTQYISKSALVAMIRKRLLPVIRDKHYDEWEEGQDSERIAILDIINNIEVKEVDEPTAADRGMVEEIIINLKRVEQDHYIDLTKEMKWLRNKAQKGE